MALYLKQCSTSLKKAYGGAKAPDLLPVPVSLTRSGYPRIIPSFHRKMIINRDDQSDMLVKIYLSFFSLSKCITLAKRVSRKTFDSIISPPHDLEAINDMVSDIKCSLHEIIPRYLPWLSRIPHHKGMTWDPTWKALPTHKLVQSILVKRLGLQPSFVRSIRSIFTSLAYELTSFSFLLSFIHAKGEQYSPGVLWYQRVRYATRDELKKIDTGRDLEWFERTAQIGPHLPTCEQLKVPPIPGRLGGSVEGGGKRRIFAIGNYVCQRLLKPVHDWLMEVLRRIPMDGTFEQTKPLDRLVGSSATFSFDLSSASQPHIAKGQGAVVAWRADAGAWIKST